MKKRSWQDFFIFTLYGFFVLFSLILVLLGTRVYGTITSQDEASNNLRTAYLYIQNKLRNGYEDIQIDNGALCLQYDGYSTYIYEIDGTLYEWSALSELPFEKKPQEKIVSLPGFIVEEENGRFEIILRNREGKEQRLVHQRKE
ncbi:DUF4860 domain-containing protein [Dubosiella newyorkensis]|uniref:DUF4860 domain-containing protein n=1 Tax=Dubosiella newyorkensis TaxID=1862672 RepID=UPI0025AD6940|nr:DUF4860 domain-containing protein [Dubosiella newyorkensis]